MIIFRYLARQVLVTMLAVTLILLLVFMSGRFIKYLAQAASGSLSPDVLFQIMLFRLPGFLELILPLGFFLGILLAYGRMYLESEMTVLHACGYGRSQLLSSTLVLALLVSAAVGSMSLFLSPQGMQKVEEIFTEQSKVTAFEMLTPGRFQKFRGDQRVTYAEGLSDDKQKLYGVFIASTPDREGNIDLIKAESGQQFIDPDTGDRYLRLNDGVRYQGNPGGGRFDQVEFDAYGIRIETPDAERRSVKKEAIATSELYESESLEDLSLLYWRISLPILVPIVTLLAVALCRVNPRQGRFVHLLPAMLMYVGYLGLLISVRKSVGKGDVDPMLGFMGVHGLFLLLSIAVYYKDSLLGMLSRRTVGG